MKNKHKILSCEEIAALLKCKRYNSFHFCVIPTKRHLCTGLFGTKLANFLILFSGSLKSQTYFCFENSYFSEMNDNFEVTVEWDNGEEDVVYITDLVFEKTLLVCFVTDESWTAKVTQIFDWNDFEVVWDKSNRKNSVTTQDVSPLNLETFRGERVKWRDDEQIEGTIARVRDVSLENKENQTEGDYNPAKRARYYVDESHSSDASSSASYSQESEGEIQEREQEPEPGRHSLVNITENRSGLIRWTTCINPTLPECTFLPEKQNVHTVMSLYQYFLEYFTDQFCETVCELSNTYMREKNPNATFVLDKLLLKQYTGIIIMTTLIRLGAIKRYWQDNSRIDAIANTMSRKTFETTFSTNPFQ